MKKKLYAIAAVIILLTSCASKVKNQEYIEELKSRGADEKEISELIKYEKSNKTLPEGGYVDVTGRTVQEVADERGITLHEYLKEYDLPLNMPGLVSETEATYTIPVSKMAEMYQMSLEALKKSFLLPDSVTEDTTWGEAIGETTVGAYLGEDNIENFKELYKLDADVNADTKWKDIREKVDFAKKQQRTQNQ